MSTALEKKPKKQLEKINGHEIEVTIFVRSLKTMFPKISAREICKLVAKYKGVKVSHYWIYDVLNFLSDEDYMLQLGSLKNDEYEIIAKKNDAAISKMNETAILDVKKMIDDNKELAKNIKVKMMDEVDDRLETAPETFSNDELIRGSKTFHEIENNMPDTPQINFNFLSIEDVNSTIEQLKRKANGQGAGVIETTGEVQD